MFECAAKRMLTKSHSHQSQIRYFAFNVEKLFFVDFFVFYVNKFLKCVSFSSNQLPLCFAEPYHHYQ